MEKNIKHKDELLYKVMCGLAEKGGKTSVPDGFADQVMQRIKARESARKNRVWHRRIWLSVGVAASIVLLLCVAFQLFRGNMELTPQHIAELPHETIKKKDEVKAIKNEVPDDTVKSEQTDTVNRAKEIQRMPKPPKRYMARGEKKEVVESVASENLADNEVAEEDDEISPPQSIASLIGVDYEDLKREIEERGRRIKENIELAINDEEEE